MSSIVLTYISSGVSIMVAVVTVYIAEHFAKMRDYRQKKIEIQLEYLKKNLDFLSEIESDMMLLSRNVVGCLSKDYPVDRWKDYNSIIGKMSLLNEKMLSQGYIIDCFNRSMNMNISIENHRKNSANYVDKLYKIIHEYIEKPDTKKAIDDVNEILKVAREQLHIEVENITDKMQRLLG